MIYRFWQKRNCIFGTPKIAKRIVRSIDRIRSRLIQSVEDFVSMNCEETCFGIERIDESMRVDKSMRINGSLSNTEVDDLTVMIRLVDLSGFIDLSRFVGLSSCRVKQRYTLRSCL